MKGNIKRVLAASGLLIAVLMIAASAFPGATVFAQGGGNGSGNGNNSGNGNGNSKAPYIKCMNGELVLFEWSQNQNGGSTTGSSNNNQGQWMQTVIGTCGSNTDAIMNQLAKQYGLSRTQLDALVAIEFRNGAIPQGFDLQTWFANYMANQNGTNNSTTSSSNSTSNSSTSNSSSTTSTNQSGSNGTSTGTNSGTSSNGGVGGAGAPAVIPTTGGGMDAVSPLVLAFGAILMALGLGVYKVSATR